MPTFFRLILVLIFSLSSLLFIINLSFRSSGYSKDFFKSQFKETGVYEQAIKLFKSQIESEKSESSADAAELNIFKQFYEEITPTYLQQKTEKVIDDTGDWIVGKTSTPPTLTVNDLKQKVLAKNPNLLSEVKKYEAELASTQAEQKAAADSAGDIQELPQLTEANSFSKFLESDSTVSLDKYLGLEWLKNFYQLQSYLFYITFGLSILSLIVIVLITSPASKKLLWLGITFTITAVSHLLVFFVSRSMLNYDFSELIQNILGITKNPILDQVNQLLWKLLTPWSNNYFQFQTYALVTFIIIAVICFMLSKKLPDTGNKALHKKTG